VSFAVSKFLESRSINADAAFVEDQTALISTFSYHGDIKTDGFIQGERLREPWFVVHRPVKL
jgi:hypothetical protein